MSTRKEDALNLARALTELRDIQIPNTFFLHLTELENLDKENYERIYALLNEGVEKAKKYIDGASRSKGRLVYLGCVK